MEFGDPRLTELFWSKVTEAPDGCWNWTAYRDPHGYGRFRNLGRAMLAHRVAYHASTLDYPNTLDHLCRNRACVNPEHMEPVTRGENVLRGEGLPARRARQTHCKSGHPLSGENLATYKRGESVQRVCRACRAEWKRNDYRKKKETA